MGAELLAIGNGIGPDRSRWLEQILANLPAMDHAQLVALWRSLESTDPPRVTPVQLRQLLAYRVQVHHHGGLRPAAAREMRQALADGSAGAVAAGTRLIREWRGRTINVHVRQDDYVWEGRAYRSLSRIAQEVTGAKWSGPRFFGLSANA